MKCAQDRYPPQMPTASCLAEGCSKAPTKDPDFCGDHVAGISTNRTPVLVTPEKLDILITAAATSRAAERWLAEVLRGSMAFLRQDQVAVLVSTFPSHTDAERRLDTFIPWLAYVDIRDLVDEARIALNTALQGRHTLTPDESIALLSPEEDQLLGITHEPVDLQL